ncbi:isoprenylcysteine carboxylmethyltransferase family protein [Rhodobacteraceae bacterium NNCM2]|nr:isoprenylcysteine carboxylmethyltransferase family protein [Coraliihabitans acroporae]
MSAGRVLGWLDMPPVWLVGFMALASLIADWFPGWITLVWPGRVLIGLGLVLAVWSAIAFRQARTTIVPRERPSALVEGGPYVFSRNPIYLADLMILTGWCIGYGLLVTVILVAIYWWVLEQRFILPEEEVLRRDLGPPYMAYKKRVGRWI